MRRVGGFLGRPIDSLMQVQSLEPGRHVGMHALRSPFPMDVDYRLDSLAGGRRTRASIRIRGDARGMYGALPGPLLGMMVRRSVQGDLRRLRRLKRIVERAKRA